MEAINEYSSEPTSKTNHALRGSLNMIQRKKQMMAVVKGNAALVERLKKIKAVVKTGRK